MTSDLSVTSLHPANGTVSTDAPSMLEPLMPRLLGLAPIQFGYVFLALSGTIPLVLVVVTIATMKCYTWRKLRLYKRHLVMTGQRRKRRTTAIVTMELSTVYMDPAVYDAIDNWDNTSSIKASPSNPNVYFQQNQTLSLDVAALDVCNSPVAVDDLWQPSGGSTSTELGSDEARALASFDAIYNGIDVSCDSSFADRVSCIGNYGDGDSVTLSSYVYMPEVPSNHYYTTAEAQQDGTERSASVTMTTVLSSVSV